jgi:putative transposase
VNPPREHSEEKGDAMALDQSALLKLLEALKAADVDDRVRAATETLYQALIDLQRCLRQASADGESW